MTQNNPLREVVAISEAELRPYDRMGKTLPKMYWKPLNYDFQAGAGNFILRMEPGAKSIEHTHTDIEQILVLEGSIIESDGQKFGPGIHITHLPGSRHYSTTEEGCLLLAHVSKDYIVEEK